MTNTPNINLTQYEGTDKINFETNYNSDMSKIDTSIADNVITSGSNANGSWTKFPDGTMICHGSAVVTGVKSELLMFGGGYRTPSAARNFPQPFIEEPNMTSNITGAIEPMIGEVFPYSVNPTTQYVYFYKTINLMTTTHDVTISWQAIGKWK